MSDFPATPLTPTSDVDIWGPYPTPEATDDGDSSFESGSDCDDHEINQPYYLEIELDEIRAEATELDHFVGELSTQLFNLQSTVNDQAALIKHLVDFMEDRDRSKTTRDEVMEELHRLVSWRFHTTENRLEQTELGITELEWKSISQTQQIGELQDFVDHHHDCDKATSDEALERHRLADRRLDTAEDRIARTELGVTDLQSATNMVAGKFFNFDCRLQAQVKVVDKRLQDMEAAQLLLKEQVKSYEDLAIKNSRVKGLCEALAEMVGADVDGVLGVLRRWKSENSWQYFFVFFFPIVVAMQIALVLST
jgi:uncharacterized coiled-coil protein SlyX